MNKLVLAFVGLAACGTSDINPNARVESATPDTLVADDDHLDDLTITVAYEDGDGDLGGGTAELHDCRGGALVTTLPIPAIAPDAIAGEKPITGTLDIHVNDVGAIDAEAVPQLCAALGVGAMTAGQAVFCVVLVDKAGHHGAGDCTQPITIQ
jgi:hypothetical protein